MAEDLAAVIEQKIVNALVDVMREIGQLAVEQVQELVSVRVQIVKGNIIRSEPGEPPRRQYPRMRGGRQELYTSFRYEVLEMNNNTIRLKVQCFDEKAIMLEIGTSNMEARPFWSILEGILRDNAGDMIRRKLKEKLAG